MSDPFSLIVSVLSEHPQAIATVASAYGVAKPFLAKVLGPAADEIGEIGRDYIKTFRATNAVSTAAKASQLLADADIEPHRIAPKVLLPLLDAASLEEDDFLRDTWAALLANAANPTASVSVDVGFVDIMKQLSPIHILILSNIRDIVSAGQVPQISESYTIATSHVRAALGTSYSANTIDIAIDNLVRLRLCSVMGQKSLDELMAERADPDKQEMGKGISRAMMLLAPGKANIDISDLGNAFIQACMPPQAEPTHSA